MFVKLKRPDLIIRDPLTGIPVPKEGKEVGDLDAYYLRRIADGDLIKVEKKVTAKAAPDAQPAEGEEKGK